MHVSPAKHSSASVTDGRTDRQTDRRTDGQTDDGQSDPYVSLCFAGDTKTRCPLIPSLHIVQIGFDLSKKKSSKAYKELMSMWPWPLDSLIFQVIINTVERQRSRGLKVTVILPRAQYGLCNSILMPYINFFAANFLTNLFSQCHIYFNRKGRNIIYSLNKSIKSYFFYYNFQ